jgi:hypothetical protein
VAGCNITITGVQFGFAVGLNSHFGHLAASSTVSITNASTPSGSAAILGTDHSTWAMNGSSAQLTLDHLTYAFQLNSITYGEHVGTRTFTNVGSLTNVVQNSIVYLA